MPFRILYFLAEIENECLPNKIITSKTCLYGEDNMDTACSMHARENSEGMYSLGRPRH
jgi:hypothetical protein